MSIIFYPSSMEILSPKPLLKGLPFVVGLYIAGNAFSKESREEIIQRDGRCMADDDNHMGYLEAAHYNHNKKNPDYDNPDNGRALCTSHHLQDHLDNEGNNGLSRNHNRGAIRLIRARLAKFLMRHG